MDEDNQQQQQGADDKREGDFSDRSLPVSEGPHVTLEGKGSWVKLLLLLEVSPDALVMVDAAGGIVSVNSQAQALFGYTYSELEGMPLETLLPERFRTTYPAPRAVCHLSTHPPYGRKTGVIRVAQRWQRVSGEYQPESAALRRHTACTRSHS